MTRVLRFTVVLCVSLAASSMALAQDASSWRSTGPWGAIEARASGNSVVLTFDGGRAEVAPASDGSYVGEWVGGATTCPAPRNGAANWGGLKIVPHLPNAFALHLTPCVAAGSARPAALFTARLTSGTSPFVPLGRSQAAARSVPQRPVPTASLEPADDRAAAIDAQIREANSKTDFGEIARMAARCEKTSVANGRTESHSLTCSNACRMAVEQRKTHQPLHVRLMVQTCERSYARAYGLPAPDYSTPEQKAEANARVAAREAQPARDVAAAPAASAPAAPQRPAAPQVPARFAQYQMPWFVYQIYDLKPDVLNPKDYRLNLFFNAYIRAFDSKCRAHLPADHVLYEPTYYAYDHTEFGMVFNTEVYEERVAESTRMRREYLPLYVVSKGWWAKLIAQDEMDDLRTIVDLMPLLAPGQFVYIEAVAAKEDMQRLLELEGCNSAFTRQFEQNVRRAIVDPPKHARGTVIQTASILGTDLRFPNVERYFVPKIPDPLPALPLTMTIDLPPPGNHLVRVQLLPARVDPFDPRMTLMRLPQSAQTAIGEDFSRAREQGQLVLTCRWATPQGLTRTLAYWYKDLAPVVADVQALKARSAEHPMLRVREARSECTPKNPVD